MLTTRRSPLTRRAPPRVAAACRGCRRPCRRRIDGARSTSTRDHSDVVVGRDVSDHADALDDDERDDRGDDAVRRAGRPPAGASPRPSRRPRARRGRPRRAAAHPRTGCRSSTGRRSLARSTPPGTPMTTAVTTPAMSALPVELHDALTGQGTPPNGRRQAELAGVQDAVRVERRLRPPRARRTPAPSASRTNRPRLRPDAVVVAEARRRRRARPACPRPTPRRRTPRAASGWRTCPRT